MFDLGLEDNGESMGFGKKEWDFALERLKTCTDQLGADCRVLMTRNIEGSEVEVGPRENRKDTSYSGKLMVRRRPKNVNDVIETRIAVVGNGMWRKRSRYLSTIKSVGFGHPLARLEKFLARLHSRIAKNLIGLIANRKAPTFLDVLKYLGIFCNIR